MMKSNKLFVSSFLIHFSFSLPLSCAFPLVLLTFKCTKFEQNKNLKFNFFEPEAPFEIIAVSSVAYQFLKLKPTSSKLITHALPSLSSCLLLLLLLLLLIISSSVFQLVSMPCSVSHTHHRLENHFTFIAFRSPFSAVISFLEIKIALISLAFVRLPTTFILNHLVDLKS
jgi:hypothetical protein